MADLNNNEEIWRPILGFEDTYAVSSIGRVKRIVDSPATGVKAGFVFKNHLLTIGYYVVPLCRKGKRKLCYIHQLVAEAFIGPRPKGLEINHKDGNPKNNSPSNLEYVTHKENLRHASRMRLFKYGQEHHSHKHPERVSRGEQSGTSKLTEEQVREIRSMQPRTMSYRAIGDKYGVSGAAIRDIFCGIGWKHVN